MIPWRDIEPRFIVAARRSGIAEQVNDHGETAAIDLPELDARMFLTVSIWSLLMWWLPLFVGRSAHPDAVVFDLTLPGVATLVGNTGAPSYERWQHRRIAKRFPPADHADEYRHYQNMMDRVWRFMAVSSIGLALVLTPTPPVDNGKTLCMYLVGLMMVDFLAFIVRYHYMRRFKNATIN